MILNPAGYMLTSMIGESRQLVTDEPVEFDAPIIPKFPSGFSYEIVGDYVGKYISAHHFSHYYSRRCQRLVSEWADVINP